MSYRVEVEKRAGWWMLTKAGRKLYGSKYYASEASAQKAADKLNKPRSRKK